VIYDIDIFSMFYVFIFPFSYKIICVISKAIHGSELFGIKKTKLVESLLTAINSLGLHLQ